MNYDKKVIFEGYKVKTISFDLNPNFVEEKSDYKNNTENILTVYTTFSGDYMDMAIHSVIYRDARINNFPFSLEVELSGLFQKNDKNLEIKEFEQIGADILYSFVVDIIYESTKLYWGRAIELPMIDAKDLMNDDNLKIDYDA